MSVVWRSLRRSLSKWQPGMMPPYARGRRHVVQRAYGPGGRRRPPATPAESGAGRAGSESRGRDLPVTPLWPHWPAGPRAESEGVRRRPARAPRNRPGAPPSEVTLRRRPGRRTTVAGPTVPAGSRRNVSLADSESARACHTGTLAWQEPGPQ
jgi:hypothetical protein